MESKVLLYMRYIYMTGYSHGVAYDQYIQNLASHLLVPKPFILQYSKLLTKFVNTTCASLASLVKQCLQYPCANSPK